MAVAVTSWAGGNDSGGSARPTRRPRALTSCDSPPDDEPVEITLAHIEQRSRLTALVDLVEEFEQLHRNIQVTLQSVGGGDPAVLRNWRETPPGERPELAMFPQHATRRLVDSGQTVAPDQCLLDVVPDMVPAIEAAWTVDGMIQAVPFGVSTPVLLYDRNLFRAGGLDPTDPPETLDEVRAVSEALVEDGAAAYGLVFDTGAESGASWLVEQLSAQAGELSVEPGNGHDGAAARVGWRDGAPLDALVWLRGMVDDRLAVSVQRNSGGFDNLTRAGRVESPVALTLHTSGGLAELFEVLDQGSYPHVDLGVAPMPGPRAGSVPGGNALWLSAGHSDAETQAAWALAAFLSEPQNNAMWAAASGSIPLSPAATTLGPLPALWVEHPEMAVPFEVLAGRGTAPEELAPQVGPSAEVHELLAQAVEAVVDHDVDPAEALAQAADDADRLLVAYAGPPP